MENDSKFQTYANELVRNVPMENLQYLIALFMQEAAINMGSEVSEKTLERTIYYIQKDFSYIPVNYIASAFIRGSLGKFGKEGAGRLVPKTIHAWLGEISLDYNQAISKEKIKARQMDVGIAMDLHKYPVGSAISKKIEWYRKGLIDGDDWDQIPLKELAEMIGRGGYPLPSHFGIETK
jgi:hypothetical protein